MTTSLTKIWKAWAEFRRGKKPSRAILSYEAELEKNLLSLCEAINRRTYKHGLYEHKIVNEKKRRDIAVAGVEDRVVHKLLYDYLVPIVDPYFDFDVWSCRKNKGLHKGLERSNQLLSRYAHTWVWRADIKKFFDNVDHSILKECLARFVDDEQMLYLLHAVIDSYQVKEQAGIPIGNLTSQIFANIYLHEWDRYARHQLKPLAYLRYGDDFIMFFKNREEAGLAGEIATRWLQDKLKLTVHPANNFIFKASWGLHFLGHRLYPNAVPTIDKTMRAKIRRDVSIRNVNSYRSMKLTQKQHKELSWLIHSKVVEES